MIRFIIEKLIYCFIFLKDVVRVSLYLIPVENGKNRRQL